MITVADIHAARDRIQGIVLRTPLVEDPTGSGLRIKAEHLQRTGSFKLRGAANRMLRAAEEGARHVVTASSGNHGQAVAYMARELGMKATVVAPEGCAPVKVHGMRSYGATVIFSSPADRIARAEELTRREGAVFIPPYDDPHVMAGQGTAGLELLEQAPDAQTVYVPVGGGGLVSGVATAIKETNPRVRVIGVEPETANDTFLSRQKGERVTIPVPPTIADGVRTVQPGKLTFPVVQRYVDEIVLVSEAEIEDAVRYLFTHLKQVVEPTGAVSAAAALRAGGRAIAVTSGSNVDMDVLNGILARA